MPDTPTDNPLAFPPKALNSDAALINRISAPPKPAEPPQSYLEKGVDVITSTFISDKATRATVDRYAADFVKTTSLFTGGKVGFAAAAISYGLGQASPDTPLAQQAEDFGLGVAKGATMKGLFHVVGTNFTFAPTKGVFIGMGSRAADDLYQRDIFTDPSKAFDRMSTNVFNTKSMLFDAAAWGIGEGAFGTINAATKGALVKSQIGGAVAMGGTFGLVTGGGNEIVRQHDAKENFDLMKVIKSGATEALVMGSAAGLGAKLTPSPVVSDSGRSDNNTRRERSNAVIPQEPLSELNTHVKVPKVTTQAITIDMLGDKGRTASSLLGSEGVLAALNAGEVAGPKGLEKSPPVDTTPYTDVHTVEVAPLPPQTVPKPVEFVMTGGKDALDLFRQNKSESAMLKVRQILEGGSKDSPNLGPEKSLFVQQLTKTEGKLLPEADKADMLATAYPETLAEGDRAKHVFSGPDVRGKVFLLTNDSGRLLLANGAQPQEVKTWRDNGFTSAVRLDGGQTNFNVMAPLLIGDVANPNSPQSQAAWAEFDRQLVEAKKLGVDSVSTDVWWGMIEPQKGKFDFSYFDKLSDHIIKSGLRWNPILSFHECGGNVGDTVNVPLPSWIWADLAAKLPGGTPDSVKYKSEQGNTSKETISLWADELAMDHYKSVMTNFQDHFASKRARIGEVNISLGPAGELRYPSYNSHDSNTGYPTRGGLQAYSDLAIASFRDYVKEKYGGHEGLGKAWGIKDLDDSHILPPSDATGFYQRGDHFNTQYGRDFFDWYNQSLIDHGQRIMTLASDVFARPDSAFAGVDLGAKVPGVHWRAGERQGDTVTLGDRQAELSAGLIRTSRGDWDRDADGRGYRPLLTMFRQIQPTLKGSDTIIVPAFTAIEMRDGDNGPAIRALPHTLATWFGQEAERQGLWLKGENALNGNLSDAEAWNRMGSLLDLPKQDGYYHGVTFLRMGDVVNNPIARAKMSELVNAVHSVQPMQPSFWDHFFRTKTAN
ncbi:MAG: family 14 glycosylhydrolase [Cyanobacteria bacterium SZAS-4]|nr:family 14 glycosylhydrolase [Cyanobacteria bacterium SZAS-4]